MNIWNGNGEVVAAESGKQEFKCISCHACAEVWYLESKRKNTHAFFPVTACSHPANICNFSLSRNTVTSPSKPTDNILQWLI